MKEQNDIEYTCWRIFNNLGEILHFSGMPMSDRLTATICLIMLRRIDCLVGSYALESEEFYLENKNVLSEENLDKALKEINSGYPFYNVSGYTFSSILNSNKSIEVTFNSYLQGFNTNIQDILKGLHFTQSIGYLQRQSKNLVDILNELYSINLSTSDVDDKAFTDLIVLLLSNGDARERLKATPLSVQKLMTECLLCYENRFTSNHEISIYDPVCGTGSLLFYAANSLRSKHKDNIKISPYGQDIHSESIAISKLLALFNGYNFTKLRSENSLLQNTYEKSYFQYILAELPFGIPWKHLRNSIAHNMISQNSLYYLELLSNTNDSQFLFLNLMISKMDPNGCRIAFISTGSMLWSGAPTSGESRIRRMLFDNDMVEAIISLPPQTLKHTSIPVYLWIITNHKETKKLGKVQFIKPADKDVKRMRTSALTNNLVDKIITEYKNYKESVISKILSNKELGKYDIDILIGKKKETITVALDDDIEEYLDKEIRPYNMDNITINYGSVEKYYSINFNEIFVKEDKNIVPFEMVENNVYSFFDEMLALKNEMKNFNSFLQDFVEKYKTNHIEQFLLDRLIKITKGQSKTSGHLTNEKGLPFIDINYIRGKQTTGNICSTYMPEKVSTEEDTLIITTGANAGEVFHGVKGIVSPSFFLLKSDTEKILSQYLYYLVKANEGEFQMIASQSMSIRNLNINSVRSLKCFLPSLTLQKEMVTALDKVINKIDKITEQLGKSDNLLLRYRQVLIEKAVIEIYK